MHLQNKDLFREVIPSKIFESFAMGLPVLIAVPEGEATALVTSNGAGIAVAPEDSAAMAEAVTRLADDKERCKQLAGNARTAAPRYDRKVLATQMLKELERFAK